MQIQESKRIETLIQEIERVLKRKYPRLDFHTVEDVRQEVLLRLVEKVDSGDLDWNDDRIFPAMENEIANAKRKVFRPTPKREATSFPRFKIRPLYRSPKSFEIPAIEDPAIENVQYASEGISFLSSRQEDIVQLTVDGFSKNEIQHRLRISYESLIKELDSIMQKPELRNSALANWMVKNEEPRFGHLHGYWKEKKEEWWLSQIDAAKHSVEEPHIELSVATNRVVVTDPSAVLKSRENIKKEVAVLRKAKIGSLLRDVDTLCDFLLSKDLNVKTHHTQQGEFCLVVRMETDCCGAKAMYIYNNLPVNPRKGHRWWWYCWCCQNECWNLYPNNLEGALLNLHDWTAAEIVRHATDYLGDGRGFSERAVRNLHMVNRSLPKDQKTVRCKSVLNRKLPRRVREWIDAGHACY